jgi:hypothetical protein
LPDAALDQNLRLLGLREIIADQYGSSASVRKELQHLDRISGVEVKDLIGAEPVHLAERIRFQKVVDCG